MEVSSSYLNNNLYKKEFNPRTTLYTNVFGEILYVPYSK